MSAAGLIGRTILVLAMGCLFVYVPEWVDAKHGPLLMGQEVTGHMWACQAIDWNH